MGRDRGPSFRTRSRSAAQDVRRFCSGSIPVHLSFAGIFLFNNGHPALRIPPLPKSCPGVRIPEPFFFPGHPCACPCRPRPAARPGPTPGAPPATPAGRALAGTRIWGCLCLPSTGRSTPRESPRAKHKAPWTGVEGNSEPTGERVLPCPPKPLPSPVRGIERDCKGGLRTPNLDS